MLSITTSKFYDNIFLFCVIENGSINFLSFHGHCSRKYNEMKNDFLSVTFTFLAKMLMWAVFLAGQIPCSLNAKDAKFWHFVYLISTLLWCKREANPWQLGFTVWMILHGISQFHVQNSGLPRLFQSLKELELLCCRLDQWALTELLVVFQVVQSRWFQQFEHSQCSKK